MSDATAELSREAVVSRTAAIPASRVMVALIRREFWEHRALWIVPLVTCVLLVISAALTHVDPGGYDRLPFGPFNGNTNGKPLADPHAIGVALASMRQCFLGVPLFLAASVMLFFYLLSSLYDERKDRSILFWKSLPVSDTATVASKLLVALVIVPLAVWAVAVVANLLYTVVWDIRYSMGLVGGPRFIWDTVAWLKVEALMLMASVLSSLWYAPVVGYLMLISAWARRNPFLWAVLPPLILAVVERVAFGTSHLGHIFLARLFGIWVELGSNVAASEAFNSALLITPFGKLVSLPSVFDVIDLRAVFADLDLWVGLIIAAAFIYVAIRVRRFRDDT